MEDIHDLHHAWIQHDDQVRIPYLAVDPDRPVIDTDIGDDRSATALCSIERAGCCIFSIPECCESEKPGGSDPSLSAPGMDPYLIHCRSPRTMTRRQVSVPSRILRCHRR